MRHAKAIEWSLRIGIFGEFLGHGMFALAGKKQWVGWIQQFLPVPAPIASQVLLAIGIIDIVAAFLILVKPIRFVVLGAAVWGFWTALVRPLVGEPIWDFVERWANWSAPLALFLLLGQKEK